jgi:hypothetical protein
MGFLRSRSRRSLTARARLVRSQQSKFIRTSSNPGGPTQSKHSTFQLRVMPENGQPEFESQISVWGDVGSLREGKWTYVRYDSDRPERCDIDTDRLAKEFGPRSGGRRTMTIPTRVSDEWAQDTASADTLGPPEPGSSPDRLVGDLSRLADLHAAGTLSDPEFAEAKARLLDQAKPE